VHLLVFYEHRRNNAWYKNKKNRKVFNLEKDLWKFHVTRSELHQVRMSWQDFMLMVITLQVHLAENMPILASVVTLFYDV
jgi:hypothetical protein